MIKKIMLILGLCVTPFAAAQDNNDKIDAIMLQKIQALEAKISNLQTQLDQKSAKLEGSLLYYVDALAKGNIPGHTKAVIDFVDERMHSWDAQIPKLDQRVTNCESSNQKQSWTEGRLCILAQNGCPSGFKKINTHLVGMYLPVNKSNPGLYLEGGSFGDSYIDWHGGGTYYKNAPEGQSSAPAGDLYLSACCRE